MTQVDLPLLDEEGRQLATLVIRTRPGFAKAGAPALLADLRSEAPDDGLEPVRLIEGGEYRFEVEQARGQPIRWEPRELFDIDDERGVGGRLRPKLSTGRVEIVADVGGVVSKPIAVEVQSTKLDYLDDYRNMLHSIARVGSELVLERFAASAQRLRVDATQDAATLYQRFALLQALLRGGSLESGLRRILATPYVAWEKVDYSLSPGRPLRGGSHLARSLCSSGARVDWSESTIDGLSSLPRALTEQRTEETLDNVPNRFVKHALEQWLALVEEIRDALAVEQRRSSRQGNTVPAPIVRGLSESERLGRILHDHLRHPLFGDVGDLATFPASNQVLQKRDGYRDVFQTYVLYEFGSKLAWQGGEDVFGAGQRDVATLYEYWVFLELARIVSDLCETKPDLSSLVASTPEALSLMLRRGEARSIGGLVSRRGRTYRLDLYFNREFRADASGGSWTRTMRPDCSLCITPLEGVAPKADELWLHFDAKYRVTRIDDLEKTGDDEPVLTAKNEDLLKMHAYRDAIVRAAGAYVVFPGTKAPAPKKKHAETIPSLGAFSLRPVEADRGDGAEEIRRFLDQVIDQLAEQSSPYERARFWMRASFSEASSIVTPVGPVSFLDVPAADTLVLIGYLRSPEHAAWVRTNHLYNLRAERQRRGSVHIGGNELAAPFLLTYSGEGPNSLYRIVGSPILMNKDQLLELGYPNPGGEIYVVLGLAPLAPPTWFGTVDLQRLSSASTAQLTSKGKPERAPHSPFAVSWLDVMRSTSNVRG